MDAHVQGYDDKDITSSIQIDDAGWGSLLGGVLIGAYRPDTQAFVWGEVPVAQFQGNAFTQKAYLTSAADVARDLLAKLNVSKEEPIHVCTGYVLDGVRQMLHAGGYNWQTAKITGPLQTLVETALLQRLHQIGVTDLDYQTLTAKQGLAFYKCLKWLKGGKVNATRPAPERERFAKTGWATLRQAQGRLTAHGLIGLMRKPKPRRGCSSRNDSRSAWGFRQ